MSKTRESKNRKLREQKPESLRPKSDIVVFIVFAVFVARLISGQVSDGGSSTHNKQQISSSSSKIRFLPIARSVAFAGTAQQSKENQGKAKHNTTQHKTKSKSHMTPLDGGFCSSFQQQQQQVCVSLSRSISNNILQLLCSTLLALLRLCAVCLVCCSSRFEEEVGVGGGN